MQDRSGRNGIYAQQRSGFVKTSQWIVAALVVGCLLLSLVWFVFVSGYWQVSQIQTNTLHSLSREEVASTTYDALDHGTWKPWDRRNIFLIDPVELAGQLRERLFAEEVIVDKAYPNVLRLLITERQRSVVLASKDQLLLVDTNGVVTGDAVDGAATNTRAVLSKTAVADPTHLPVIVCELPELAAAGYQAARPEDVRTWIEAYKSLTTKGMRFRYLKVETPGASTARLEMEVGYEVVIDLSSALEPQIDTYKKFVQGQTKDMAVHEYVDVRVPGKVFLK